jgi:hypothetical protein
MNKTYGLIILLFVVQNIMAQQIAFPTAEGFGKYATGGRGGQVAFVTNLNDDGDGSFRNALLQFPNEPLTILFKVSGIIELKSKIQIKRSNLTIAGQSAPGDGICFKGNSIILNGASQKGNHGNIIIRYIRSRPGSFDKKGVYGFDMENCHDVIIDHCSFSWANEECVATYDTKNITIQWCIVSEGLFNAGHMKGNRGYGGVWGGQFASYHHNLLAHLNNRAFRPNGARAHDTIALIEYSNNVIYNWASKNACYGGEVNIEGGVSQINMLNNYYKPGPAAPNVLQFAHASMQKDLSKGVGQWHLSGNIMEGEKLLSKKNFMGLDLSEISNDKEAKSKKPFLIKEQINLQNAKDAFKDVLAYAGAIFPNRDSIDRRVVNETRTGTASGIGSLGKLGIIDNAEQVGGWFDYKNGIVKLDSDNDGMPDDWEEKNGLNKNDATDRNILDSSGYTMLEKYLNEIVSKK